MGQGRTTRGSSCRVGGGKRGCRVDRRATGRGGCIDVELSWRGGDGIVTTVDRR